VTPPITTTPIPIETFDAYSLTCTGPGGSTTATVFIAVVPSGRPPLCGQRICPPCNLACVVGWLGPAGRPGQFTPYGDIRPGVLEHVLVVQSGTVEAVRVAPADDRKSGRAGDKITTITISPGATVVTSDELGSSVHVVKASDGSVKLLSRLPAAADVYGAAALALLAAEHPGAKPTVVGVALRDGKPTGLLIARDVLPPSVPPAP
jgi:hypothetical protein